MKFLSQLFEVRGTDWTSNAFKSARLKLIGLYLVIIAIIIALFAYLVILQVNKNEEGQRLPVDSQIVLTVEAALTKAKQLKPEYTITDTQYLLENNTIIYQIHFSDGDDVDVNMLTGAIQTNSATEKNDESLFRLLTNEINEIIWWLGLFVFLLASIGSIIVANVTLKPIMESVKKQKRFVSDVSHELRNPLASLQITLESYIREEDKSVQLNESVAQDLLTEVKRLILTSESLLALEKSELHKRNITNCSVAASVDRAEERLRIMLKTKNIKLKKQITDQTLRIDITDLDTIFYNLIHNAIKFSPKDSEVTIEWNSINLCVADTGVGIEEKHIPHIFDRFYKADEARGFETSSNGIGLSLVKEIVTSYRGKITVDSLKGKGTNFTVTF